MKENQDDDRFEISPPITVIVPTYNRPNLFEQLITQCVLPYIGSLFRFEIHDSSFNDDIKEIFDDLCGAKDNCSYFRYENTINFDVKQRTAAINVKTEYVYLLADGRLVDFNKLEELLLKKDFFQYDVIDINSTEMKEYAKWQTNKVISNELQCYSSLDLFFRNCFSGLTLMGAYFAKTSVLRYCFSDNYFVKYSNKNRISWPHLFCLFDGLYSLSRKTKLKFGFTFTDFSKRNPNKAGSGWQHGDLFFEVFFKDMYYYMKELPGYSDTLKNEALFSFTNFWGTLSNYHLIVLKKNKTLTLKRIRKYKVYIKGISSYYSKMLFYCLIPSFLCHNYKAVIKRILGK